MPDVSAPAILPGQPARFETAWASFLSEVHRRIGTPSAAPDDPVTAIPAPGAAYSQTWAQAVTDAVAELQANQTAIIAALKAKGLLE